MTPIRKLLSVLAPVLAAAALFGSAATWAQTASSPSKPKTTAKPAPKPAAKPAPKPAAAATAKPAEKPAPAKPTASKDPLLLGQYGDWSAYTASPDGKKVCFVLGKPGSSKTNPPNRPRDPAYFYVSTRPAEKVKDEISVIIGYSFKPKSEAKATIGSENVNLYTEEDGAWAKDEDQSKLVEAMRKGEQMVITGTSSRGTETTDVYSLKGISQALDRVGQECK